MIRNKINIINFAILSAVLLVYFLDFNKYLWINQLDEGQWLFYAKQLLDGKVLYKDIWYQFGPMLVLGLKWAMIVFGKSLAVERIYFWSLSLAGLGVLYLFSYSILKNRLFRMILCLLVLLNSLTCRLSMDNPAFIFRQCFNLLPLYFIFINETRKNTIAVFVAGFTAMLSILISQETGIFVLIALSAYLILDSIEKKDIKYFVSKSLMLFSGFASCLIIWGLYCFSNGCFKEYFVISFRDVLIMAGKYQHIPFPGITYLLDNGNDLQSYYHILLTYVPFISSFIALLFAFRLGYAAHKKIIAVSIYGMCSFSILMGRCDIYHSTFAALAFFIICLYWFEYLVESRQKTISFLLLSLIVACVVLFNLRNIGDMLITYEETKNTVYDAKLPYIGAAKISTNEYNLIYKAKQYIESQTTPADAIFVMINSPFYYFFIDRPAFTRFATPIYANNDEDKSAILNDLKQSHYPFIIYERTLFQGVDYEYYTKEINSFLKSNYSPAIRIGKDTLVLKYTGPKID